MKATPFTYHNPSTLGEAIAILAREENAKVLAGGQSLLPMLHLRYAMPDHLVDIRRIDALQKIEIAPERVSIGAIVRQRSLETSQALYTVAPIFRDALHWVGHMPTRNRGTIGGSLAHLDPAAELPGVLAVLDAVLEVEGTSGRRDIPIAEWSAGFMQPALAPEEILTAIRFAPWPAGHRHAFVEFSRRRGDLAVVGCAALLCVDAAGIITRAALALVGVAYGPRRLTDVEAALVGTAAGPAAFAAASAMARQIETLDDAQYPATYRKQLAAVMVRRALEQALR